MPELEIENPNLPVTVQFELHGPIFESGLPIPLTVKTLESVQGIVDRSFLVLSNKKKLSSVDRAQFFLRSRDIRHSSLRADLELVFAVAQPVLPFISNLGPTGVWEYTKLSFEFLKMIFLAKKDGQPIQITNTGDGSPITVITGEQHNTFNAPVFQIAAGALPHYENLTKQLATDRVNDIRLGQNSRRDIAFTLADAELFHLPSTIEEQIIPVSCEVFEFDKYDGIGRLSVFPDQPIAKGEYKFTVIGDQDLNEYIESMKHSQVVVTCLKETVDHPLFGSKIVSLQVTNVRT